MENTQPQNRVTKQRRPGWVWFIFGYTIITTVFSVFSFWLIKNSGMPLDPKSQALVDSFTTAHYVWTYINLGFGLIASIALFMLKKIAFPIYCVHFGLMLLSNVFLYNPNTPKFALVFGIIFNLLILFYTKRLIKRGVLR